MKLKFIFLLLLVSSNFIFSQKIISKHCYKITFDDTQNGIVKDRVYTCKMFDWKIKIPLGYNIMHLKALDELCQWGFEAFTESTSNADTYKCKRDPYYLISFGIDKSFVFTAVYESLVGTEKMTFEEHKRAKMQSLSKIYSKIKEVKALITSSNLKIGSYDFYRIETKIYDAKTDELVLTQELYNSFINSNVLFSATINYTKEEDGKLLKDNFISSLDK